MFNDPNISELVWKGPAHVLFTSVWSATKRPKIHKAAHLALNRDLNNRPVFCYPYLIRDRRMEHRFSLRSNEGLALCSAKFSSQLFHWIHLPLLFLLNLFIICLLIPHQGFGLDLIVFWTWFNLLPMKK